MPKYDTALQTAPISADGIVRADPDTLEAVQRYLRRLLEFRSRDGDSLKLAVFHLTPKFQELWTMANDDPPAFARFLRSRDLPDVRIEKADWPNFTRWVNDFALPYLQARHAAHAKARDHQQHMTELMNLTAMEGYVSLRSGLPANAHWLVSGLSGLV